MKTTTLYNISLKREDAVDLVALLINYYGLVEALYKNIEPTGSTVERLNGDILKQLIANGLILTERELAERTKELAEAVNTMNL